MRKTHRTTADLRAYETSQTASLSQARRLLDTERANLDDQKALQAALEKRIATLRSGLEADQQKTPNQVAKERLDELRRQKKEYDAETSKLLRSLNKFMDNHLGAMLAAEDLGGPVVGDMMDIDTDELGAGFNAQGKLKKSKRSADQDVRQRRIDEIWGDREQEHTGNGGSRDEASAAVAEMRELTEHLLNSLSESAGDSSAAYVSITRETAAVRFLVRSKVAQFHPKDATRLRLIDFGREIDE
jgi:hypothetical protein